MSDPNIPRSRRYSQKMWSHAHCKHCGEMLDDPNQEFCSDVCSTEYTSTEKKRNKVGLYVNIVFILYFLVATIVVLWTSGAFNVFLT